VRQKIFVTLTGFCALISLGGLSGCALYVKMNDGNRIRTTSAEFSDYAARVFRLHNKVTTDLAYTLDEIEFSGESNGAFSRLIDADDRMLQACSAVDDVAIARRDGDRVSLRQLNRAAKFIPDCEKATLDAAKLIAAMESD
jgi:hypothetical protein